MSTMQVLAMLPLALGVLTLAASAQPDPKVTASAKSEPWKLVWADEFDTYGPPNARNWTFEKGFERNEEEQWYQPENAWCRDGKLVIEARREKKPNPNYEASSSDWRKKRQFAQYTSSSLTTNGLHYWTYGRFEVRARIDTRSGIWPAFWTVGKGEWPECGEIDILEYYRGDLMANVAWGTSKRWTAQWDSTKTPISQLGGPDWSSQFHVWRMDWDEEAIRLFVDDKMLNETLLKDTINGDAEKKNPFHAPQRIILNLAIGGQSGGDPSVTQFPSKFEVDYVRVYQKPSHIQVAAK